MRQFVFLDELKHLETGNLAPVDTRDDMGPEVRRLRGERGGALLHRLPQRGGEFAGSGIGRQAAPVFSHPLAALRVREILLAGQEKAGESVAGVEDVERDLPES